MKKIIDCLLLFALPGISFSDGESKRESVEELLVLTDAESVIDNVYSQMVIKSIKLKGRAE